MKIYMEPREPQIIIQMPQSEAHKLVKILGEIPCNLTGSLHFLYQELLEVLRP